MSQRVPPLQESGSIRCDECGRKISDGEVYWELLKARRVVGEPPPYAGTTYQCERCEFNETGEIVRQALGA